jgi:uroporphyrinogen decarboxylase
MSEKERKLHRHYSADLYIEIAEKYEHSAIFLSSNPDSMEELLGLAEMIREKTGNEYFLMTHGDATFAIPNGNTMQQFAARLADDPKGLHREAQTMVENAIRRGERLAKHQLLDGFAMCADYCFNNGPFLSPAMFSEFVTPYLEKLVRGYRDMGFYTIKHTDGNIMPIIDQLVEAAPDALHSLDPQGGVDIAEVKRRYGDRVCLIGNVNCGQLQTGTNEEVEASVRYCLKHGMPGGGYIFSTSNCIYTGMPLERYDLMLGIWRKEGNY